MVKNIRKCTDNISCEIFIIISVWFNQGSSNWNLISTDPQSHKYSIKVTVTVVYYQCPPSPYTFNSLMYWGWVINETKFQILWGRDIIWQIRKCFCMFWSVGEKNCHFYAVWCGEMNTNIDRLWYFADTWVELTDLVMK